MRRTDDTTAKHRAILETAARLICKKGYEGTSIQEIADACGLTKAGLYHHIESKEQLLVEIMNYGMDVFEERVLSEVEHIPDPVERLKACMAKNIKLVTRGWSKEVTIILHEHDTLTGKAVAFLERNRARARRVRACPLHLGLGRPVVAKFADDLTHAPVGLDALAALQSGPELQHPDVGIAVGVGVDRVGEAALLAYLVEQP